MTFLFEKQCIDKCPKQTYQNSATNVCDICTEGCKVCDAVGCTTCFTGFMFNPLDLRCYKNCPDGTFNDYVEQLCQECSPTCASCSALGDNNCLSCTGLLGLFQGQCLEKCPGA